MMQNSPTKPLPVALAAPLTATHARQSAETAFLAVSAVHLGLTHANASPAARARFWESHKDFQNGLYSLSDALSASGIIACAGRMQRRALFMALPAAIIIAGIGKGFSDPVVRAAIFQYVENHREIVKEAVKTASSAATKGD